MGLSASQVQVGEARQKSDTSCLNSRCEDVSRLSAQYDSVLWRGSTCVYTHTHTHTPACTSWVAEPSGCLLACRACNLGEVGATDPPLADHPG